MPTYPRLGDSSVWKTFFGLAHRLDKRFWPEDWQDEVITDFLASSPAPVDEDSDTSERVE